MSALSPKQLRFVDEYLVDLNATAAYKRAGYKGQGRTAENNASRLLGNAGVQQAIQERIGRRARETQISAERVLKEIAAVALSDLGELVEFTAEGIRFKPEGEIPEAARRAVSGVKVRKEYGEGKAVADLVEFKLWPKVEALKQLAMHLGLLKEVHEITGRVEMNWDDLAKRDAGHVNPVERRLAALAGTNGRPADRSD
jgi:phage terminase small subunit